VIENKASVAAESATTINLLFIFFMIVFFYLF
jgi:hypothetical protein